MVLAAVTWGSSITVVDNGVIITNKSNKDFASYQGKKKVTGESYYPYLMDSNINNAINSALEKVGPQYDLLIDVT